MIEKSMWYNLKDLEEKGERLMVGRRAHIDFMTGHGGTTVTQNFIDTFRECLRVLTRFEGTREGTLHHSLDAGSRVISSKVLQPLTRTKHRVTLHRTSSQNLNVSNVNAWNIGAPLAKTLAFPSESMTVIMEPSFHKKYRGIVDASVG
jgi:hypothetical protein